MMALTDASRHDWLQGRGPEFTLIGFQDDATGQILAADFQLEAEAAHGVRATASPYGSVPLLYRTRNLRVLPVPRGADSWTNRDCP